MHRSRFCALVIDCKVDDIDAAATFWSRAFNKPVLPPDADSGGYRELSTQDDETIILVQKVDHDSRVHLDIEADDLDAEVKRLEALGAKRVAFVRRWWVMEAPTGHRFCVVRPQRGPLEARPHANSWDEQA
jgi:predicted enzyme related to lactoylglutathione lyase